MKYSYFEIENFKGIEKIRIDIDKPPRLNVYTLVGLNESGKTTILEAINAFTYKKETLEPLDLPRYSINDVHELIPISKRENFNDSVKITVGLSFEKEDEELIKKYLWKEMGFRLTKPVKNIHIEQIYKFDDSKYNDENSPVYWNTDFVGKKRRAKTNRPLGGDDWKKAVQFIKQELIPSILYFPNFLFDFPNKIYLEDYGTDDAQHRFYRAVIQDILDSLGTGTNVETHLLQRAKSSDKNDKKHLNSLLLSMGRNVSKTVFQAWSKIFKREIKDIEITISCDSELAKYFLEFQVRDSDGIYAISDRSLGFRWFFVFLLLTQYRGFRKGTPKNVLFLFDEPASNLHPTAQAQLLSSLDRLTKNCTIIYTTHSRYLINPDWLEGAYVVKNEGLDYNDEETYTARQTKIVVERYRSFAAKHPDQTTYFQPILDVLDYCPSRLENIPNLIMCEGKNDFYLLNYFSKIIQNDELKLQFLPGTGAGSLDVVIKLYIGWGLNFIILLDSDSEGAYQKQRYIEKFGAIVQDKLLTLEDIDKDWNNYKLENIIPEQEKISIQKSIYPESEEYNKTHFYRSIQENFVRKVQINFSKEASDNLKKVLDYLNYTLNKSEQTKPTDLPD